MSLDSHLRNTANLAIIRDDERDSIQRSIAYLSTKLTEYFGNEVLEKKIFGSYSRETILPRYMDENSDIDYMIVFRDSSLRPQSYLDRLRRFVETTYPRSQIRQSSPTIQLELNHIRFELVPAIRTYWGGLQIPDSTNQGWMGTDPTDFNQKLVQKNQENRNLIKPLIRVVKYWNAQARYPFESYALEQRIVDKGFFLTPTTLGAYFQEFMGSLDYGWFEPQSKREKIDTARSTVSLAYQHENMGNGAKAELTLQRLLPSRY